MGNRKGLINRMVVAIIASRFAPIEFVLACSALVHGLWLVLLDWHVSPTCKMLPPNCENIEMGYSWYMILAGASVLLSSKSRWPALRSASNLMMFIGWAFSGVLVFFAAGASSITWIVYLTVALIQALVYLNVNVGVWDGND